MKSGKRPADQLDPCNEKKIAKVSNNNNNEELLHPAWTMFILSPSFTSYVFKHLYPLCKGFEAIMEPIMSRMWYRYLYLIDVGYLLCDRVPLYCPLTQVAPHNLYIDNTLDLVKDTSKLKYLRFNANYNIYPIIPPSVTRLIIGGQANAPIEKHVLPQSLTHLAIWGDALNYPLPELPSTLTTLSLRWNFNQPLKDLPNSLKKLVIRSNFNYPIDDLPDSIISLTLSPEFTERINKLPKSLKKLKFPDVRSRFNHPLQHALPNTITKVVFGTRFNHPVDNLPHSITHLTFGGMFNQPVDKLPPFLTHLSFVVSRNPTHGYEPPRFDQSLDHLPGSLIYLNLNNYYNRAIDHLPELLFLEIGDRCNISFDVLPPSLVHLKLGAPFGLYDSALPSLPNLKHLISNCRIDAIPPSTTHFQAEPGCTPLPPIPASITHLRLHGAERRYQSDKTGRWDCAMCYPHRYKKLNDDAFFK